jgi:hypothetical protein
VDLPSNQELSARFCMDGVLIEVEPCAIEIGTWRAREVRDMGRRGEWFRGRYAWQAMEAVVTAAGKTFTAV